MSSKKHIDECLCSYCSPKTKPNKYEKLGKLDLKYSGIIYKGLKQVPADEWIVFRAQDNALVDTLIFYLGKCIQLGIEDDHKQSILDLIGRVRTWRALYPEKCKTPDTEPEDLFNYWPEIQKLILEGK